MRRSEIEIIRQIRDRCQSGSERLLRGIGDDCAVIRRDGNLVELVTTDTLIEGVHFDRTWHPPVLLGRKAAAVNLSDIAAMGGDPRFAFLSLGLPVEHDTEWLASFTDGFLASLQEHSTLLAGGDTVLSPPGIVLSVTVLGESAADKVLLRSTARVGDLVLVSGCLGEAAAGLELCRRGRADAAGKKWQRLRNAHLDPQPEIELGQILAGSGLVSAMMDLSDGLATDLANLCRESGVGAEVDPANLPMSPEFLEVAAALAEDPRAWALTGGEDYRLLLTAAPDDSVQLGELVRERLGRELYEMGRIVAEPGVRLLDNGGGRDITDTGYDHFRAHGR